MSLSHRSSWIRHLQNQNHLRWDSWNNVNECQFHEILLAKNSKLFLNGMLVSNGMIFNIMQKSLQNHSSLLLNSVYRPNTDRIPCEHCILWVCYRSSNVLRKFSDYKCSIKNIYSLKRLFHPYDVPDLMLDCRNSQKRSKTRGSWVLIGLLKFDEK